MNKKTVVLNAAKMNYDGNLDFSILSDDVTVYDDTTPEQLLEKVLAGFDVEFNDKIPMSFYCDCNKSRVEKVLISVGKKDLQEMIADGKPIEVNCHFCNTNYTFEVDELKEIYKKSRA